MFEQPSPLPLQGQQPPLSPGTPFSPGFVQGGTPPSPTPQHVYTMPEKFLQPKKPQKGSSKKFIIILSIIGAVVVIVVVVIVYAFQVSSVPKEQANQNATVVENTNEGNQNAEGENKNENVNTPLANVQLNANENTNALGTPLNVNTNTNENVNTAAPPDTTTTTNTTVANTNTTATVPDYSAVANTRDKDRDGLTDVEEELYGTKFHLPDTDKDGYVDGTEIRNLFSPTEEGATLEESGLAIEYQQKKFGWSILYPAQWIAEPLNETKKEILFTADTVEGEFVEVIVTENPQGQTAVEWYTSLYTDVDPDDLQAINLGGLQGILVHDGFAYYLANSDVIIAIIYNFGTKEEVSFRTTFEMMAKSFAYTGPEDKAESTEDSSLDTQTETNTNTSEAASTE